MNPHETETSPDTDLDATEQKRIEEALRESAAAKDRFLAMLAHELRNPLGAVSNALQVMRTVPPDHPSWTRSFQVIERQVKHQAQLLNDLLEVSRLTRGTVELHRERLDLSQLVSDTFEDSRAGIVGTGLAASLEVPGRPVWVEGDPARLSQILSNLLHNAVKFSQPGGRVEVRLAEEEELAVVRVIDTGIGIEPAMLSQIWEAFNQVDVSLDRTRGGLGLGLALVKGLVELHGGTVLAESEGPGRGARFTITLPLAAEPAPPERKAGQPDQAGVLSILIIEDNPDAAETLADLLRLFGHEVELAHSGPAGIEAAQRLHPDIVLCDIGLPGMDGYAVARHLRQDPATASLRLIALTGYGRESDRRMAREAGFDLHLVKPVEPTELQRLLTEWASQSVSKEVR